MNHQAEVAPVKPGTVVVLACLLAVILIAGWVLKVHPFGRSPESAAGPAVKRPVAARVAANAGEPEVVPSVEDQWGIRVAGIKLTSANLVMELSYQVTDPAKAALLNDGTTAASVLEPTTGTTIRIGAPPQRAGSVSQHSRARSAALMMRGAGSFPPAPNRIVPGKTYTVQLPNAPDIVKKGVQVVVVIGDVWTDDITVQ